MNQRPLHERTIAIVVKLQNFLLRKIKPCTTQELVGRTTLGTPGGVAQEFQRHADISISAKSCDVLGMNRSTARSIPRRLGKSHSLGTKKQLSTEQGLTSLPARCPISSTLMLTNGVQMPRRSFAKPVEKHKRERRVVQVANWPYEQLSIDEQFVKLIAVPILGCGDLFEVTATQISKLCLARASGRRQILASH